MTVMPAALVLAGGGSTRLGRDKLALRSGTQTLLGEVLAGALLHADPVIAIGPPVDLGPGIRWTREEPPGSGPVSAIAAGLALIAADPGPVDRDVVCLLAGDAPRGPLAIPALVAALAPGADGCVLMAGECRQYLCSVVRASTLRDRIGRLPEAGASMRDLFDGLSIVDVPDRWDAAADIDTEDDARRLGYS